jgi:hypothetical protein
LIVFLAKIGNTKFSKKMFINKRAFFWNLSPKRNYTVLQRFTDSAKTTFINTSEIDSLIADHQRFPAQIKRETLILFHRGRKSEVGVISAFTPLSGNRRNLFFYLE